MEKYTCLSCLSTNKILKNNYCSKCIKELFNGSTPNLLNFNKVEFTKKRAELSPRMLISGVQDKISLTFEKKDLISTATNGKYILKLISNITKRFDYEENYKYDDFRTFAKYIDLPEVRFNKIMKYIEDSYLKVKEMIDKSFLSESAKEFYKLSYKKRMKRIKY